MARDVEFRGRPMPAVMTWVVPLAMVVGMIVLLAGMGAAGSMSPVMMGVLLAVESAAAVLIFFVLRSGRERALRQRVVVREDEGVILVEHFRLSRGIRTGDFAQRLELRRGDIREVSTTVAGIVVETTRGSFIIPGNWPDRARLLEMLREFATVR